MLRRRHGERSAVERLDAMGGSAFGQLAAEPRRSPACLEALAER